MTGINETKQSAPFHWLHKWSKWEAYTWVGKVTKISTGQTCDKTEERQKRTCLICGYVQDELI